MRSILQQIMLDSTNLRYDHNQEIMKTEGSPKPTMDIISYQWPNRFKRQDRRYFINRYQLKGVHDRPPITTRI